MAKIGCKAGPLEAILVIFGGRPLIFLFENSCKKMKMTPFWAHVQWWSTWTRKNVKKKAPLSIDILLSEKDRNGFRRVKGEG